MKRVVLWCVLAVAAWAQDAQVRGKQLIDEAVAALGGDKFLYMETRIETGRAYSFFQSRLTGLAVARLYTRYVPVDAAKAGEVLALQEHQAYTKDEGYFNVLREEGGWEVTYRGPTPLEKDQVARYRDSTMHNVFYILRTRLREPGLVFESRGSDVIDNTPMNIVDIIDAKNRVVTVYLHPTTKLPLRQMWEWRDPETRERNEELTRFSRYREVDGVQWPHQVTRDRNGRKVYEMFDDEVEINALIEDRRFAIPDKNTKLFRTSTDPKKKK